MSVVVNSVHRELPFEGHVFAHPTEKASAATTSGAGFESSIAGRRQTTRLWHLTLHARNERATILGHVPREIVREIEDDE